MIEPFFFTYLKFELARVCASSYCVVICVQAENRNCFNSLSYNCIDITYNLNEPNRCSLETKSLRHDSFMFKTGALQVGLHRIVQTGRSLRVCKKVIIILLTSPLSPLCQPRTSLNTYTTVSFSLIIWALPRSLLFIQSCNRHAIRANVNKPSDANVSRALCHNTAFIFVTYVP